MEINGTLYDVADKDIRNLTTAVNAGKVLGINESGTAVEVKDVVSAVWGGITGTLANQTDLNTALNGKASTSALSTETTNRTNADSNLQTQIDAITAQSDVSDVVGTKAELSAYSKPLYVDDIVKVLNDESQSGARSYYRCTGGTAGAYTWTLIGTEAPSYTKSETYNKSEVDSALANKVPTTRTVDGKALSSDILVSRVLTKAQYNALTIEEKNNGTSYYVTDEDPQGTIAQTTGQSTSDTMSQKAITDELNTKLDSAQGSSNANKNVETDASGNIVFAEKTSGGSSRQIGEILTSTIPQTDAGLHLLDGTVINGSGAYADFYTFMVSLYSTAPQCFCTEAQWQQAVSDYGVCGKFVLNTTAQTVRLPKYGDGIWSKEQVYSGGSVPVFGNGYGLGLTNNSEFGAFTNYGYNGFSYYAAQVSYFGSVVGTQGHAYGGSDNLSPSDRIIGVPTKSQLGDNPEYSGLIADVSNITTTTKVYYYIVLATTTNTQVEIDINQVMTEVNNKVDKSLLRECHVVIETYVNGTSGYRIWDDGYCEQWGSIPASTSSVTYLKIFRDTNYNILVQFRDTSATTTAQLGYYVRTSAVNGFTTFSTDTMVRDWKACGYLAEGEY